MVFRLRRRMWLGAAFALGACLILSGVGGARPAHAAANTPNYLHTSGSTIVDSNGHTVRLTGINWFGLETATYAPHGLWARSMGSLLDQIKSLGYNTIRVPYSNQLFDPASTPNGIDPRLNPDLVGLDGLHILDKLVAGAGARGLKIILDRHRPGSDAQSALWYTDRYSEQRWIGDWTMLAARYKGNDTVIGFDLHNEPHGAATWGTGDPATDWRLAAQRAGNAILAVNPNLLIIVQGVETVNGSGYWWGGNLSAAGRAPVQLTIANRVVYSAHDYPASVYNQPWFTNLAYPDNLHQLWDSTWGYLARNNIAPVWVGEFGTRNDTQSDRLWLQTLARYIGQTGVSFAFWALNPDSGDTGGILADDWQTVNQAKQSIVRPLLAPPVSGGNGTAHAPSFAAPAAPAPATPQGGNITAIATVAPGSGPYWGQETLTLTNAAPMTALTISVTVQKTPGVGYIGQYTTFWGGTIAASHTDTGNAIVYTYTLNGGQSIVAGNGWLIGSQFSGTGTPHPTTADSYSITVTSGGATTTLAGHF